MTGLVLTTQNKRVKLYCKDVNINEKYYYRLIDRVLKLELESFGAVLISGPKWSGKTTTALRFSNSMINLQDPINKKNYLNILSVNPDILLTDKSPMLIDEWQ